MAKNQKFIPNKDLKLMDQVREVLRYHHYAYKTEQTYCKWIVRYIKFHKSRKHPEEMGKFEIDTFLSHLAVEGKVSAATQNQTFNSIVFLYKRVLDNDLTDKLEPVRATRQKRLPVVMTKKEVRKVLSEMQGTHRLMSELLYGCGLRLMECVRLRIQDVDFENNNVYVRSGKGGKDRTTVLPQTLVENLQAHIERIKKLHKEDLENGSGEVYIPESLLRKYNNSSKKVGWQYIFPSRKLSVDPRTNITRVITFLNQAFKRLLKEQLNRQA